MTNPTAPAAPPRARPPAKRSSRLPWALVAILAVTVIGLVGMLSVRDREVTQLRAQLSASPSAAPPTATQDPQTSQILKSLPRRDPNDPRALGRVDAPVILIEWSDYRCPFCAVWANRTLPALQPYIDSGSLRVEFRDLVLFGEESELAAIGARAAGLQGKYWEFHKALFAAAPTSGHPTIKEADLLKFAEKAGVPDMKKFRKDLTNAASRKGVVEETMNARQLGIGGTPFFVINTTPISGAQPTATFIQTIEGYGAHK